MCRCVRLDAMRSFQVFLVLLLALSAFRQQTWAGAEVGKLSFCLFGPKMKVLSVVKDHEGDPCTGSAKVQGVLWKCEAPDRVEDMTPDFRNQLNKLASAECAKHCAGRSPGCKSQFTQKVHCGLETDRENADAMGKRLGCRSDCAGPSFAYCSLYDAAFQTDDRERMKTQAPNCRCVQQ